MKMYRKAAVFLHGLAAADRDWLLARLDGPQRAVLDELLDELSALGIPRTPSVLGDVGRLRFEDQFENQEEAPLYAGAPAHVAALAAATPQALWSILEHQPDAIVSAVLSAEAWPWRDALLERMPALRRASVERRTAGSDAPTPKALDALLRTVARCLSADEERPRERVADARRTRRRSWWLAGRRRLSWQP